MRKVRVYLDNCCFNRPYDDQTQLRIFLESQAKLAIQNKIKDGEIELVTSYMTAYENAQNPFENKKKNIFAFQNKYSSYYVGEDNIEKVKANSLEIEKTGIKHLDACHIVCAIEAKSDYFISTDDRLLKYQTNEVKMIIPVDFILETEDM